MHLNHFYEVNISLALSTRLIDNTIDIGAWSHVEESRTCPMEDMEVRVHHLGCVLDTDFCIIRSGTECQMRGFLSMPPMYLQPALQKASRWRG